MSGGVPKRISISRTQANTYCKSGGTNKVPGLVLCSRGRSRTAMCNYIKKRATPKFNGTIEETYIETIPVTSEITVSGNTDTGTEGLYTYYAFKNIGSGSISFDFPTGTVSNPLELEVFVVGGGGGGGGSAANAVFQFQSNGAGGGGGGGQVNITTLTYTNGVTNIPITVGGGGAGGVVSIPEPLPVGTKASNGDNSSIGTIISKGGLGGTTTAAGQSLVPGAPPDFVSGGSSFKFNGSVSNNGGKGWLSSAAVGGGGAGTLLAGENYDPGVGNPPPPLGDAGDGGAGVNSASGGTAGQLVASWNDILNAINLPAANGFGGGGGGGAASNGNSGTGGTGSDGGANGAAAGTAGVSGPNGLTSSETAAVTNNPINTQVTLAGGTNRGGGGGGSVSYAQKQAPTPPPTFAWPNPPKANFTPVDQTNPAAAVEAGGKGGSGLVIFRFLTAATVELTKSRTLQRKPCADGLNK